MFSIYLTCIAKSPSYSIVSSYPVQLTPRPLSVCRDRRRVSTHIQRMEREGVERVKMFVVIVIAYLVFWGPLFLVTLARPGGELVRAGESWRGPKVRW